MLFITHNTTPYVSETVVLQDKDGVKHAVAIVKTTFNFTEDGRVVSADEQVPLVYGDQYRGEPGNSSLAVASDIVFEKGGTDVLLNGHAYAPKGQPVKRMDVVLGIGSHLKRIRVTGDRIWKCSLGMIRKTAPVPFKTMPLVYERAFGGSDMHHTKESKHGVCKANPVGTGFRLTKAFEAIDGLSLPNIENPKKTMKRWKDKPDPAGFGPIAPSWSPRREYAGTFDDDWKHHRMPLMPKDFDPRFNNSAPPDSVIDGFLIGGEEVLLKNLHPKQDLVRFSLPRVRLSTGYIFEHQTYKPTPVLDTLIIEPDAGRLIAVFRSSYSGPDPLTHLKQVTIAHEETDPTS